LSSPDKKIAVSIAAFGHLIWSARYNAEVILLPSTIALTLQDGKILADKPVVSKAISLSRKLVINAPVPVKRRLIPEEFNELTLQCKGNYSVIFRAYNDGIAYRFTTSFTDSVTVTGETSDFNFSDNFQTAWPFDEPFSFSFPARSPEENVAVIFFSISLVPDLLHCRSKLTLQLICHCVQIP
jgi:alpha-glucosidase